MYAVWDVDLNNQLEAVPVSDRQIMCAVLHNNQIPCGCCTGQVAGGWRAGGGRVAGGWRAGGGRRAGGG